MSELEQVYTDLGTVRVSLNLWEALKRVRGKGTVTGEPMMFWADQICINQQSNVEKSLQVPLMSKIFPRAERVLCWLGKDLKSEQQIHRAIDTLRQWSQAGEDPTRRTRLMNQLGAHSDQDHPQQTALRTFFSCGWFQRVWTLQEIYVSDRKPPVVLCPRCPCEIDWKCLREAFVTLAETLPDNFSAHVLGEDNRFAHVMFIAYRNREQKKKMKFSSLLQQTAERGVTRGRDRVYGLLSIMQQQDPSLHWPDPDYCKETSKMSIFKAYTRRIIENERSLDILSFKKHAISPENISSWAFEPKNVTTIGSRLLLEHIETRHREWSACGETTARLAPQSCEDDRTLGLYGIHVGTIARVFCLEGFLQRMAGEPGTRWRTRWSNICDEGGRLAQELQNTGVHVSGEEDLGSAILRTLVINDFWTLSHNQWQDYATETTRLYSQYLAWTDTDAAHQASGGAEINGLEYQLTYDDFIKFGRRNFQLSNSGQPLEEGAPAPDSMDKAVAYDFYKNLKGKLKDMQLAVTTNGRLALVPHIAGLADKICVLLGGYFPLVLRSCDGADASEKRAAYRLMGPAFMRELVGGQALEQYVTKMNKSPTMRPEEGLELLKLN